MKYRLIISICLVVCLICLGIGVSSADEKTSLTSVQEYIERNINETYQYGRGYVDGYSACNNKQVRTQQEAYRAIGQELKKLEEASGEERDMPDVSDGR